MKLELLIFLSGRKPGNLLASGGALDPHSNLSLVLGAGLAQDHYGIQRLGVQPGDQVDIAGTDLLPKLPNLDLGDAHTHKGPALTLE